MASSTGVVLPSSPDAPVVGGGDVQGQPSELMLPGNNDSPDDVQVQDGVNRDPALPAAASHDAEDGADQQPSVPAAASDGVEDGVDRQLLRSVTAEGDTALHVLALHGDSAEFLDCASIINIRDKDLLFVVNRKGDTPLHCAARAGNSGMVSHLIRLAGTFDKRYNFIRKENGVKETALHEAVRINNKSVVTSLWRADSEFAHYYPEKGTSPLYLAILLGHIEIAKKLHGLSGGKLSYAGPHGRNALHAATYVGKGTIELMLSWNNGLTTHGDRDGSTPLHLASSFPSSGRFLLLLQENPAAVYQADNKGLFPIHVAASQGVKETIRIILKKYPSSAALRTAQGRTFLHVAVEKRRLNIVSFVCQTPSLAWILNMRDNDGNTALHLAVQSRKLRIFCSLYGNKKVHLYLANNIEEAPIEQAAGLILHGLNYTWNNELQIYWTLGFFGYNRAGVRLDQYEEKYRRKLKPEEVMKDAEKVKDSSQILCIVSVLIATVSFGATFAVPGGFVADDHTNRGTPTLAGRYTFDAFMMATALAFVFSMIATVGLTFSGSSMVSLRTRQINLSAAVFCMSSSLTSLTAAFALGVYMVLAPVSLPTAVAVCMLSPLVVLYSNFEFMIKFFILTSPMYHRIGPIRATKWFLRMVIGRACQEFLSFIIIFVWAAIAQKLRNH